MWLHPLLPTKSSQGVTMQWAQVQGKTGRSPQPRGASPLVNTKMHKHINDELCVIHSQFTNEKRKIVKD